MIIQLKKKSNKYNRNNIKIIAVAVCAILFSLFTLQNVEAQNNNSRTLDLNEKSFSIASYSYVTIDKQGDLSSDIIFERYQNNLYGIQNQGDIINLGTSSSPAWILFSVHNNTNTEDWVLDFGNILDGRMGMAKKIHVINYSNKQAITYPSHKNKKSPFIGSALPIKIDAGKKNVFVLYIENSEGLPLIISPKIMSKNIYMKHLLRGDNRTIIAYIVFLGTIFFFAIHGVRSNSREMLALLVYYILLGTLFFSLNSNFISTGFINGKTIFLLYMASFLSLIIAAKIFIKDTTPLTSIENMVYAITIILIISSSVAYITIFGGSQTGMALVASITALCLVSITAFTILQSDKPKHITMLFCAGIGLVLLPSAIILISSLNNISIPLVINLFWYLQIPIISCFIAYHFKLEVYREEQARQLNIQKSHDEHSIYKLQKSKNSADQARLLRIIDQEKELMAELRQREVKRTEEMRLSKDIADKANQDKSAFLAVVSHEIRTPMNGILGMVQLLQDTGLTDNQLDYIDIIHNSGKTMMALLNDILDFEKIENGNMDLEIIAFDLKKLANDVVLLMSAHAEQKGIMLSANISDDTPNIVMGDPTRLRQVLLNLINNSIKFTEEGHVTIDIKKSPSGDNNLIYFAIKDSGIGISKDVQAKLFTPFKQAETSISRKYGGTGLGLAISNKLIEAMGTKIKIESVQGVGSTFSFEIKLEEGNQTELIESDKKDDQIAISEKICKPLNILVVEDNEMNRKVLEGFLIQSGHILSIAANGIEALNICQSTDLDLILMDIQMDGMSGIEATHKLRADDNCKNKDTPIIAITGSVMLEDIESFFDAGMNGFVAKPIDAKNLKTVIYNASIGKFENKATKITRPLPKNIHNKAIATKTHSHAEQETKRVNKDFKAIKNTDELTDIQKYLIDKKPQEKEATRKENNYLSDIDDNLDTEMLDGLINTLGKDKFMELLKGFVDKSDEIINNMVDIAEEENIPSLGARAHELKGMSGNFGMKKISAISNEIETAAKMSNKDKAIEQTGKLNAAIEQTKAAFDKWVDNL